MSIVIVWIPKSRELSPGVSEEESEKFEVWEGLIVWLLLSMWKRDHVKRNVSNFKEHTVDPGWQPANNWDFSPPTSRKWTITAIRKSLEVDCSPGPPGKSHVQTTPWFQSCELWSRAPSQSHLGFWPTETLIANCKFMVIFHAAVEN